MNVQRYRKKPVVVEAVQWDGTIEEATAIIDWILDNGGTARYRDEFEEGHIAIDTLEGTMALRPTCWAIRGIAGEFYPCDPDVFAGSYDTDRGPTDSARARSRVRPIRRGDDL